MMKDGVSVALLLNKDGCVCRIFLDAHEAMATRDRLNADPFIAEGVADVDAPYSVESWVAQ